MTLPLLTLEEIAAAARRIEGVVRTTPLLDVADHETGAVLGLKCENLQATGSFKLRGACNLLTQLSPAARAAGVIAYSSGNHGQAVAYAARLLRIPATVVMPETAVTVKVEATRRYGAEVLFAGTTSLDRQRRAEAEAASRGLTIVPPFDHPAIAAGAGTTGLEILSQRPGVTTVYVPMGGGGQVAGVAAALKLSRPAVRVVGVEPQGAARMTASRAAGEPVTLPFTASIADGLLTLRPGDFTFPHVQAFVDQIVPVSEEAIAAAVGWLFRHARIVAEPSGAASVAAALQHPDGGEAFAGSTGTGSTVAIVSGGNVEAADYARYITE